MALKIGNCPEFPNNMFQKIGNCPEFPNFTVAILLVSADFLASDFITDNELPPILRNAEEKGTRIIPLIVKPCRFTRDKNLKHFLAINDPKDALIHIAEGDQERLYDMVSAEVERTLQRG
jgi:hypothetical protein